SQGDTPIKKYRMAVNIKLLPCYLPIVNFNVIIIVIVSRELNRLCTICRMSVNRRLRKEN
ncbi:MAG: hypothetical protein KAR20_01290, partial [Candidatus Heimdallarchaeota archaeon]|nr:hypothetical protein [Candidatus Heimdallarchaeota archaeon]